MKIQKVNSLEKNKKMIVSTFILVVFILNLGIITPLNTPASTTGDNGDYNAKNVSITNTSEAQLMVRVGDVDNFGFGWPNNFDPFSGNDTPCHGFPFYPSEDPDGTDSIMVTSGYKYGAGVNSDGYTGVTNRTNNEVRPIKLNYSDKLNGITVRNAVLQMFVDDFQPMKYDEAGNTIAPYGIPNGNNRYTSTINGVHVPELDTVINNLNQGGPIGKLITFDIPDRFLYLVENGKLSIKIDDVRPGITGDGYAIDFVKLLINVKEFSNSVVIKGVVEDGASHKLQGVAVSASGIVTTTNNKGEYELQGVPAGQVIVNAVKPGYKSQTRTIYKVVTGGGYTENFKLQHIEKLKTPTFDYAPKAITNENVKVTIDYPGNPQIKEYRIGREGIWQTYNGTLTIIGNCVIEAKSKDIHDNFENVSEIGTLTIDYIKKEAPEVKIKVSHAEGMVRDTYEATSENYDKRVDKILNPSIILKGDAYANISVKSDDIDFFEYRFINSSEKPEAMPKDGWEKIDLNGDTFNKDVIIEKKGFLNQRAYDVSHMPWASDEAKWSNPELVFKSPFDATNYKAATYSATPQQYGNFEDYFKSDGTKSKRWLTNSIFSEHLNVDGTDGITNYKEASKFWGYIKVPKDGDYNFGAISDDGCRGYITVDGEVKPFVDMFKVQAYTFGTINNIFHLKANEYYPVYLEYFNWGQWAIFQMLYSDNGSSPATRVPTEWFYPSQNLTPGEYASSIFTGSKGVKFPKESGDYYIAYRTGNSSNISHKKEVFLSDIPWKSAVASWGTVNKDKSIDNNILSVDGKTYKKGIGTHADSEIIYELKGNYNKFTSIVGIDDEMDSYGSVVFKVFGDGKLLYTTPMLEGNDKAQFIDVNVKNVNELKLVVYNAGDGIDTDHADWADAKLITESQENVSKAPSGWETVQVNNSREGIYGPFTVNGKPEINVWKAVKEGNKVNQGNEFMLEYKVNPEEVLARSTFKNADGTFKEKIYLSNVKLQDEYPENIQIKTKKDSSNIIVNGQKITVVLDNIEYKLTTKNEKKVYSAQPVNIQIPLIAKMAGEYTLSEKDKSIITFTDVNEANRQIEFQAISTTAIDKVPPSAPIIGVRKKNGKMTIAIYYPKDAYIKQYKIGEGTGWMYYSGEIVLDGGAAIYARCYDEAGNESKITRVEYH